MEKFNQNLQLFLNNIKLLMPESSETIDATYKFDEALGDKYLTIFYSNIYKLRNELSNHNEVIFSADNIILENIDFNTLWNSSNINDTVKGNIWRYLNTLYLFSYEYTNKIVLTNTLKRLKKLSKEDKLENISDDELVLINIINQLSDQKSEVIKTLSSDRDTENIDNTFIPPEVFNGVLGDLAQEIAQEIDPSKLNLDDPSKLIKNLLSGNIGDSNDTSGLSTIIKQISGKIQSKIDNGSLNDETMLCEAQNVMSSLTNNGSMADISNLMGGAGGVSNLEGLMSSMTDLFNNTGDGGPDLNNLFSGMMNKSNLNKSAIKSSQEKQLMKKKLRNKLKVKKDLLKQREVLLNSQSDQIQVINAEKDLDTLVREIEAAGSSSNTPKLKKKKKKKKKIKESQ